MTRCMAHDGTNMWTRNVVQAYGVEHALCPTYRWPSHLILAGQSWFQPCAVKVIKRGLALRKDSDIIVSQVVLSGHPAVFSGTQPVMSGHLIGTSMYCS